MSCRQSCDILQAYSQATEPSELPTELPPIHNPELDLHVSHETSLLMTVAARRPDSDPVDAMHAPTMPTRKRRRTKPSMSDATCPPLAPPASVSF